MIFTREIKNLQELANFSHFLMSFLQPNIYLVLSGELGVGKTTLTQLIAQNLGIGKKITSPTFTILQRYQIKDEYYLNHFDFFRLNTSDNLNVFQELAIDNLNIIEWPEKNPQFWQEKEYIHLKLIKQGSGIRVANICFSSSLEKAAEKIKKM